MVEYGNLCEICLTTNGRGDTKMSTNEPGQPLPPAVLPPPPRPHPGYAAGYPPTNYQAMPGYGAPPSDVARMMQYDAAKKSAGVAYVLWFFLGGIGAHRFYLEQTGTAVAQLIICIVSII